MNKIQRAFRAFRIVPKHKVALLFEEIHLQNFLNYFSVDCIFDVGANNGQYATMLRNKVGYKGDIVSFEPIPASAEILREKSRKDARWHIEEVALDTTKGTAPFNVTQFNQFSSLHKPSHKEADLFIDMNNVTEQIVVQTATVADMFEKYKKLLNFKRPFLKMDTQGHDLAVAQGAGETLRSFVGLQSELSIKKLYEDAPRYTTVLDYYTSQGFELSAFVPNNEGHFPNLIEIDCIMYNKDF